MGNSTSSRRRTASSGTRELEKYTKPTGLYPTCPWELKTARRMIMERKIAPRFPGRDAKESGFTQECPICFMYYPGNLNVSTCCKKPICSECFLQMKPPKKMIAEVFGIQYTAPAAGIELASIPLERSAAPAVAKPIPLASTTSSTTNIALSPTTTELSHQYASVEDRQKLRDDLRTQLNIAVGPITSPAPPSVVTLQDALVYASPADASQLEELMLLEAIRRSMVDVAAANKHNSSVDAVAEETAANDNSELHMHMHSNRNSNSSVSSGHSATHSFDDDDALSSGERDELPASRAARRRSSVASDWNPLDHE